MYNQIRTLLQTAWQQISEKLKVVSQLIEQPPLSMDILQRERTRFSLNNKMLQLIEQALQQDEIGVTNSQFVSVH